MVALWLRDAQILSIEGSEYCFISLIFSLIAFSAFRLHDGFSRFFSVNDAWRVVRAIASAELITSVLLFTFTRLNNIPRSAPVIHALILCAGLIAIRAYVRWRDDDSTSDVGRSYDGVEHVIMIGTTKLTFLYVKFLETYCPGQRRVIALLDAAADMTGRTISGIPVVGPPDHLQVIIDEFAEHGTSIDRVVVGGDEYLLPEETLKEVQRVCVQRAIPLHYVPELVGLSTLEPRAKPEILTTAKMAPAVDLPAYFKWKYALDFAAATAILILYAPILVLAGGLALLDVGWPAVFWQQRVGIGRQGFKIYKIRTMRPPFDQLGQPWPEDKRLSWVGTLLRRMRLDELPQLVNVLVGDMSLIGPRPLLPCDQPANPSVRLMIRPGITGWAQVNGGTLLSPSEKDALDEWYIRNASFWLDLRIIVMTLRVMIWGQHRSDQATLSSPVIRSAKPIYLHANESAVVPARRLVIPSPILSMGTKSKRARV